MALALVEGSDLAAWTEIVNMLGVPVALIGITLLAAWRTARWMAPRLDRLFEEQRAFIRTTAEVQEKNSTAVEAMSGAVAENTEALHGLTTEVRALREVRQT